MNWEEVVKEGVYKENIMGSYVAYICKNGARRVGKVVKINGNTITIVNSLGGKKRVYKDNVIGIIERKKGFSTIPIKWRNRK